MGNLIPPDAEVDAGFGSAIATDGSTLVVGAPSESVAGEASGAAYVYERGPAGTGWRLTARLGPTGVAEGYEFGHAVAVSGDRIVIGSPGAVLSSGRGLIYIFRRTSDGWELDAQFGGQFTPQFTQRRYGYAVALNSDTVVVGTDGIDRIWVNEPRSPGWSVEATIDAPPTGQSGLLGFGRSLAISEDGNTLVVGAPFQLRDTLGNRGVAHVYGRDVGGENNWGYVARLRGQLGPGIDGFGSEVSIHDGVIAVVAAPGNRVFVFEADTSQAAGWTEVANLAVPVASPDPSFRASVSTSGDRVAVGTHWGGGPGETSGAAWIYERDVDGLGAWQSPPVRVVATDATPGDAFGYSLALSGEDLIVGARYADSGSIGAGSAYAYRFQECRATPTLLSFDAVRAVVGVSLWWTTTDEDRTAGYLLQRRGQDGRFVNLTPVLIPAVCSESGRASYRFFDSTMHLPDPTQYAVVSVDDEGRHERLGRVTVTRSGTMTPGWQQIQPGPTTP